MQERQVSLEGETMKLPEPFIVIATQNPIEYEGTFPLPEAQLDRFLVKLSMGYPEPEDEARILFERQERKQDNVSLRIRANALELLAMRRALEEVHVNEDLTRYIVALTNATRADSRVAVGSSPRGSLALLKLARAQAALDERDYVLPDDIKDFVHSGLGHRLILNPDLWLRAGGNQPNSEQCCELNTCTSAIGPLVMPRLLVLTLVLSITLIAGLASVSGDMLSLAVPLLLFMSASFYWRPETLTVDVDRSLESDRVGPQDEVGLALTLRDQTGTLEDVLVNMPMPEGLQQTKGSREFLVPFEDGLEVQVPLAVRGSARLLCAAPLGT